MSLRRRIGKPIRNQTKEFLAEVRFRLGGNPRLRRRAFLAMKTLSGGIGYAAFVEPFLVQITQVEVAIPDLPWALDGYRIAHLSDIHYNVTAGRKFLRRVVERVNGLDADMVALTGDFITHNPRNLDRCFSLLSDLNAPDGCWVVRGNHDHNTSLEHMIQASRDAGFRFLENSHAIVRPLRHRATGNHDSRAESGERLVIAGVGDMWEGECNPSRALAGASTGIPTVMLSHHPHCAALIAPPLRVDLMLSGHTHGGQLRAMGRGIHALSGGTGRYVSGLVKAPHTAVYISRGVGTSALRVRWNCLPEVALIHLHRGDARGT